MISPQLKNEILTYLGNKFGRNLIAVYGIGSAFVSNLAPRDVDVIVILNDLEESPSYDWTEARFEKKRMGDIEVWLLYGTTEAYMNKKIFTRISFANWEWAVRGLKHASELVYGTDIRPQLPEPPFDYDDILIRVAYHLEPTSEQKRRYEARKGNAVDETMRYTKAVFKFGFFAVAVLFPDRNVFDADGIYRSLTEAYERELIDGSVLEHYDTALAYRRGTDIVNLKDRRDSFIRLVVRETIYLRGTNWDEIKKLFGEGFGSPFSYLIRHIDNYGWET